MVKVLFDPRSIITQLATLRFARCVISHSVEKDNFSTLVMEYTISWVKKTWLWKRWFLVQETFFLASKKTLSFLTQEQNFLGSRKKLQEKVFLGSRELFSWFKKMFFLDEEKSFKITLFLIFWTFLGLVNILGGQLPSRWVRWSINVLFVRKM